MERLVFVILFGLLLYGCDDKKVADYEKDFESARISINNSHWDKSIETLERIPEQSNTEKDLLLKYSEANLLLEQNTENDFQKSKEALKVLNEYNFEAEENFPFFTEAKQLRNKLHENISKEIEAVEDEEKIIVTEAYDIWRRSLTDFDLLPEYKKMVRTYKDFKSQYREEAHLLYLYAYHSQLIDNYRNAQTSEDSYNSVGKYDNGEAYYSAFADKYKIEMLNHLKDINPELKGASKHTSNVISNLKSSLASFFDISESEWIAAYNGSGEVQENAETDIENRRILSEKIPSIGMKKEDVLHTKWGEPKKVNKTSTSYGVSEQWVYEINYKRVYLYIEDGVVTAIQE